MAADAGGGRPGMALRPRTGPHCGPRQTSHPLRRRCGALPGRPEYCPPPAAQQRHRIQRLCPGRPAARFQRGPGLCRKIRLSLCRWSSTEAVAEALGGSAPVWLGLIDYGGADSQTAIPGLGSFHGLPLALFSSESSYSACADLSSAGAQALSARLKQALASFMTSGSPAGTPGRRKTALPSTSMPTAKPPASPSTPTRIPRKASAPPWPQTRPSPPPKRKRWSTSIFPVSLSDEAKTHLTDSFHR